jgi:hypothetical protein
MIDTGNKKIAEIDAADAKWDTLFATEKSQKLLEKMADEAWSQIQAGQSRPMVFTQNGEIVSHQVQQI